MSSERQTTILGLVEEAKKRILFLVICVVGLSYLMSLTSSSVWVNLPAAALLIIFLRYLSLDFDVRRKEMYKSKSSSASTSLQKEPLEIKAVDRSHWRRKINSPVVEDAIEQFTRHLVSEWVTDLWYSRITPDKQAPDELVLVMNGVLGELSCRMRNINLIDFLTRDIVNIICNHLELFRARQKKNVRQQLDDINFDQWDMELKSSLVTDNKLHPALFSAEAEHKVLQHLMDGLISFAFKPEDLQCSFFRYTVRELLACAVIRPVLNLANPRFVNERIEALVISRLKATKGASLVQGASPSKENDSSRISCDHFSRFLDPSVTGVELVQLKNGHLRAADKSTVNNGMHQSKDPLLSVDTQTTRSWSSLSSDTQFGNTQGIRRYRSGGEWGDMLDMMSHRKTQALAPENFENMWTRGRNYRKREGQNRLVEQVPQRSSAGTFSATKNSKMDCKQSKKEDMTKVNYLESDVISLAGNCQPQPEKAFFNKETTISGHSPVMIHKNDDEDDLIHFQEVGSESSSSYSTSDVEASSVTGLDSPVTKVWDGRNNRNLSVSHVHHPLESSEGHTGRNTGKGHARFHRFSSAQSGRGRRSRRSGQKVHIWKEVERTSFLSGDGQDLLNSLKEHAKSEVSSDDSEAEIMGRVHSGASASSSVPLSHSSAVNSLQKSLLPNSFLKLRCEVLGANIVKGGSRPFAVYCISVTDVNSSWSIKRRFRHFEQLHRRLKEFLEYNLHLPPKHFLSTGLDVTVIQERCKLLDVYLKKLLQLPTISGSIEVWDFLSVDSQTYMFLNSFSVIETLSVDLDDKPSGSAGKGPSFTGPATDSLSSKRELLAESKEFILQKKHNSVPDKSEKKSKYVPHSAVEKSNTERRNQLANSGSDSDARAQKDFSPRDLRKDVRRREGDGEDTYELLLDASIDPALPTEWLPPNLSIPILDLVDVIFQLQDGGWIRRKAFWVAKQVLQLGMGDAFDDWLIDKIQHLRKGSVIASGIKRVEQILWPDGIFITRHPKRQRPTPPMNPSQSPTSTRQLTEVSSPRNDDIQKLCDEQQKQEAFRRAKFVYELMIDNAPAAVVGLVGRKEYEQCAKDLYFFLQSSVCLKQVAFDLLELLLLSAFPELDHVIKQVHEEKHKFGEFKPN